ncbi:MAG: SRPBCC family protein [Anaerolineae bacterium]
MGNQPSTQTRAPFRRSAINIGRKERRLCISTGLSLAISAWRTGSMRGTFMMILALDLLVRGITGYSWLYRRLGINTARGERSFNAVVPHQQGNRIEGRIRIDRPVQEVYAYWRSLENLPQFLSFVGQIEVYDETHSKWTAQLPAGIGLSWDTEILTDEENQRIAWQSAPNAAFSNAGAVNFTPTPDGSGTDLTLKIEYTPPAGAIGSLLTSLFESDPNRQIGDDLQRLKETLEMETRPFDTYTVSQMNHGYDEGYETGLEPNYEPGQPREERYDDDYSLGGSPTDRA